ncbi:histidine--tRNA ligase [Hyphomicrobium sp. 802]|uniref:histidine--tRNA ligase n=1 Tax=Hyphomicrobium sp. 802 TaxID=1112272 RepID=UPI00045EA4AA|nr:histidine--tRNA ligase [Hyphomicrobium sp. 802]
MSKANTNTRPEARLAKGFRDIEAPELKALNDMTGKIREVYERYGFEALETPAIEYTDALGKFLPDQDRPNAGVFSFQDEDEQWMSLRYDLTAPLARYVAQNFQTLPKPFRRYAFGYVYRNEKPGPGRFRQFMQFDADTVGAASVAADAELCMLAADTLEALGVKRGDYRIKVNNRKILDGILETVGIDLTEDTRRLAVLRSLDKLDKFSKEDVALLLGPGRKDESGDFTKGAGLNSDQIDALLAFVSSPKFDDYAAKKGIKPSDLYLAGSAELVELSAFIEAAGYEDRVQIDFSVVRGLEYYTGPVFEAELTFEVKGDDGKPVRFGSVGGGGRYDDLVARFTGEKVPATGFSIGVSRLQAALSLINAKKPEPLGPVVVLVMDKGEVATYQKMTQALRNAGIRAEMYLGSSGMKAQMKYADKRNSPCVIIQGSDERAKGEVTIKDLIEGAKAAAAIKDNKEWKEARPAQFSVSEAHLVQEVHNLIKRHQG